MPTLWEALQEIVSLTRHVNELQTQVATVETDFARFREVALDRIRAIETGSAAATKLAEDLKRDLDAANERLRTIEGRVIATETLQSALRETVRETVRDTIRVEIAEERARQAEERARQQRPALEEG